MVCRGIHRRRLLTPLAALVVLAIGWAAPRANAFGIATHAWLAEESARRLAQADPSLGFLASDPYALACYRYGAFFPDMRSLGKQATSLAKAVQTLESQVFIQSVRVSLDDLPDTFRVMDTHESGLAIRFVERARASGDRYQLAFALGCLTHILQDKYAQMFLLPSLCQEHGCGDLGVDPTDDPASLSGWYPGKENELVVEATGDLARPAAVLRFIRDAPWLLDPNPAASYQRALALRRAYWQAAVDFAQRNGRTAPTERGIMNGAMLHEAGATFYPFYTGHEPAADIARLFIERYVELEIWAQLLYGVAQLVTQYFTQADLYALLGPFVPIGAIGGAVGGQSPLLEAIFAQGHGQAEIDRVNAAHQGNPEFRRLKQSGLLEPSLYTTPDYELCQVFVVDGCTRLAASPLTDDAMWPRFSRNVQRAASLRSLMTLSNLTDVARASELLVFDVHQTFGAGGPTATEVRIPSDTGRTLRAEVELYTSALRPEGRLVRLRLFGDVPGATPDPVLAEGTALVWLDARAFVSSPRPTVSLEWTVADVPGARGVYLELDEMRLGLEADADARDRLFVAKLDPLESLMTGRPHYARHYATYDHDLSALRIRR